MKTAALPPLLSSHPPVRQAIQAGIVPTAFGALCGWMVGVSKIVYLILAVPVAIGGGYLAGIEHDSARSGAIRGLISGALFGWVILIVHELTGQQAKAELPHPPVLLALITAVLGAALGALGAVQPPPRAGVTHLAAVRGKRGYIAIGLAVVLAMVVGAAPALATRYEAKIRRTEYGIPHIKARSYGSLGFGFGYAFAEDNICTMAETYVTVNAQRSQHFGPNETYRQRGNLTEPRNLDSDFFWQQIIDSGIVEQLVHRDPPLGLDRRLRRMIRGYVAGYNRYLRSVGGSDGIPDPRCRGAPWVQRIDLATAYRRFYQLILLASQGIAVNGIGGAQPPVGGGSSGASGPSAVELGPALEQALRLGGGSNAVAIGGEGTRGHTRGVLLGNPHFAWYGPERFYQFQYTLPGKLRVSGATLFGVPLVLNGYTPSLAWSHTVSTSRRFTLYELNIAPGDPTSYMVDGQPEKMTSRTVTVQVRQPDGSAQPQTRTLYSTRWGPLLSSLVGIPLPWTTERAFVMADANVDNVRVINHYFETNHARSVRQELDILRRHQGIPWVNTIAADRNGEVLYSDIGSTPNVPDAHARRCNTELGMALFEAARLAVLDGSRSECAWLDAPDAARPGIFGPGEQPWFIRRDYAANSNDSHWLSNPRTPLEGFARIIGDERAPRTLRTRIGLVQIEDRIAGRDGLGPPGFTRGDMQRIVFNNRVHAGELTRDAVVDMCREFQLTAGLAPSSSGPMSVGNACDVLASWDLTGNTNAVGYLLFRMFWRRASQAPGLWSRGFDPNEPLHTPNTLNTANPQVRLALGDAINDLRTNGIPLDAPVGEHQYVDWGGSRIPLHGGDGDPDGTYNMMHPERAIFPNSDKTLFGPGLGSSYVQVVGFNARRCPRAATILTYSQSENPDSPHRADQTRLYSDKRWVKGRFCEAEINASPALKTQTVRGRRR
jgi:acyl-homoserine-lactone acylase